MTNPITPEARAALKALCDAATPGPWRYALEDREPDEDDRMSREFAPLCFYPLDIYV